MYTFILTLFKLTYSYFFFGRIRVVTPNYSSRVKWIEHFFVLAFFFCGLYIYITYFTEPIHCSAPNVSPHTYAISTQNNHWRILSGLLHSAMDAELDKRGRMHITSSVVSLGDIGVKWHRSTLYGMEPNTNFPDLVALYQIRPEWFIRRGDTKVAEIIVRIANDTNL